MELISPESSIIFLQSDELVLRIREIIKYSIRLIPRAVNRDNILDFLERFEIQVKNAFRFRVRV